MAVAATTSGGATIAPRTKATGQEKPAMTVCATTATATVVKNTHPTARSPIGRRLARKSRQEVA